MNKEQYQFLNIFVLKLAVVTLLACGRSSEFKLNAKNKSNEQTTGVQPVIVQTSNEQTAGVQPVNAQTSNEQTANAKPAKVQPVNEPKQLPENNSTAAKSEDVSIPGQACKGQKISWNFADFPSGWNLSKSGRISDAIENESVTLDPLNSGAKVLQVAYGKGTASPAYSRAQKLKPGGTQFFVPFQAEYERATLSYWVLFGDDFNFVKGGKLPGLASNGELISGGETPDGKNGFSLRLMWRSNGAGELYAYIPKAENEHLLKNPGTELSINKSTGIIYGWSIQRGAWTFSSQKWHHIEEEVIVNQVGKADGVVKIKIDGKEVLSQTDIVMRTTDKLKIGGLFFSTFYGGSSSDFATVKDEKAYFRDFSLCAM